VTIPRFTDGIKLVVTPTAISCADLFVVSTLTRWRARSILLDAVFVTEELATSVVKATGVMDEHVHWTEITRINFITVHLLGWEDSIRIEVWDSAPTLPLLPNNAGSPVQRGCYATAGGKVVWAELSVLPQHRKTSARPQSPPENPEQDPDLLRRVLDGLDRM
jgi:hypothetical protein